jgi:hypothetical protein
METGRKLEYSGTFYRPSASCFFTAAKELRRIRFSRAGLRKKIALVTLRVFRARHISNCQLWPLLRPICLVTCARKEKL